MTQNSKNPIEANNKYKDMVLTIPNILSFFRILLIPYFVWLYRYKQEYDLATVVLLISGVTDVLDGYIARRFNMISEFGKVLDPTADKLTQAAILFCLIFRFTTMQILFIYFIIKEIFLLILGIIALKKDKEVQGAERHGKAAAFSIYVTLFTHIIWFDIPLSASIILTTISLILMTYSLILYSKRHINSFKE